jgi:NAD+--dinitrogen-reductase ADP-D-ribosyltransferase
VLAKPDRRRWVVLLNNLSSFSVRRERAEEFGDHLLRVQVPLSKVFFYNRMLPGMLKGEDEYVVIGLRGKFTRWIVLSRQEFCGPAFWRIC